MKALRTIAMLAALAAGAPPVALALTTQAWPNRPVRMIVPFAAGGSTDVVARLVGDFLSRSLGQQFFVENRAGANGVIGMDAAAKSAPGGYTVLVTADAVASNPHVYKVGHDPLKDLTPVIQLSRQPVVLAVHPSLGVGSLDELVALVKKEPGLRYATGSGQGSPQHMVVQWFAKLAGIELEQVCSMYFGSPSPPAC
jgi:tripartite-type tricarboxylate transporter receptor subunit TctC